MRSAFFANEDTSYFDLHNFGNKGGGLGAGDMAHVEDGAYAGSYGRYGDGAGGSGSITNGHSVDDPIGENFAVLLNGFLQEADAR